MVFKTENIIQENFQCSIENIETLFNLQFKQSSIKTRSFSFYENELPVKILDYNNIVKATETKKMHEVKVPEFASKFSHLRNKRLKMVKFLAKHRLEVDINIGGMSSEDEDED